MKTVLLPQSDVFSGSLILVNAQHPLKSEPAHSNLVPFPSDSGNILLLNSARPSLIRLMDAVGGWKSISVCSGWRSSAEQEAIYQSALAERGEAFTSKFVARPSHSEHQTGLAVDLGVHSPEKDALCPEFPDSGVCRALRQKAAAFGWIKRYPKGKETLTQIAHEPWHFRYVGIPHASAMEQMNLTLEEYIDYIRQFPYGGEWLACPAAQGVIQVCFLKAEPNGITRFTADPHCSYAVSGNNSDGFLITEWSIAHDGR